MLAPTEFDDAVDRFLTQPLDEGAGVADVLRRAQHRVRRRRARSVIAMGLVAAISVFGVAETFRARDSSLDVATRARRSAADSKTTTTGSGDYSLFPTAIPWVYRGTLPLEVKNAIDQHAYKAWRTAHPGTAPDDYLPVVPLWSGRAGAASVVVFETGTDDATPFVAVYVEQAGVGELVADDVPPLTVPALSWTFAVDGSNYTLVLGPGGSTISTIDPAPPVQARGNGWVLYRVRRNGAPPRFIVSACGSCQPHAVVSSAHEASTSSPRTMKPACDPKLLTHPFGSWCRGATAT